MRLVFAACLLALLSISPSAARAWGYDGHRIVCAIAWDQLTPAIRAKVSQVLEEDGKDAFVENCLWPDEVRPWRKETALYHYVNVLPGTTTIVLDRDCPQDKGCVVTRALIEAGDMRRTYSRDAVRFLAHFVGDMHQPLHTGYAEDAGGNLIKGKFMGQDTNMHGLWDYGLLEATGRSWREIAADLNARITQADRWTWTAGTALDWANATLALAQSPAVAYRADAQPFDLGRAYLDENLPTVYGQLQRAGVRLADLMTNFLQ